MPGQRLLNRRYVAVHNVIAEAKCTFFATYKRLRRQTYNVLAVGGPERAAELFEEGAAEFLDRLAGRPA